MDGQPEGEGVDREIICKIPLGVSQTVTSEAGRPTKASEGVKQHICPNVLPVPRIESGMMVHAYAIQCASSHHCITQSAVCRITLSHK